jgi:SAM-dependent methyltransferase
MAGERDSDRPSYDALYRGFDSPVMRRIREEAYGEDIGQHSWVTASELRADIGRLNLSPAGRLLDLGCGPCGPLAFIVGAVGCRGTGIDASAAAVEAGHARIASLGLDNLITIEQSDLNEPLAFAAHSFDAVIALDVVLHLRDRGRLFQEIARVLKPRATFLFTDASVVTGSFSSDEARDRSAHGYTQFAAPNFNERMLESAGFHVLETEDRTVSVSKNATGRLAALLSHNAELESLGIGSLNSERRYLETVAALSQRRALSRIMYLAESRAA